MFNGVRAGNELINFWDLMAGFRKDWSWWVRFMVIRERDIILPAFRTDLHNYIELGENPEPHNF